MAKNKDSKYLMPILSIILGIVVIAWPAIIAYALGIYLIIMGILKLVKE